MITEDYCTEELVKLLLEKGCPLDKVIKQDRRPVYFTLPTNHPNWADCDAYYIPTHAQIMKWLREEHNIFIVIEPHMYDYINEKNSSYVTSLWQGDNYYENITSKDYPTFEEAVDATLKCCLTELI